MQKCILGESFEQCPMDFPYSFDYGSKCCFYDQDNTYSPISYRASTCLGRNYRFCPKDRCLDNSKILLSCIKCTEKLNDNVIRVH